MVFLPSILKMFLFKMFMNNRFPHESQELEVVRGDEKESKTMGDED